MIKNDEIKLFKSSDGFVDSVLALINSNLLIDFICHSYSDNRHNFYLYFFNLFVLLLLVLIFW